jgi:hypothetical protein
LVSVGTDNVSLAPVTADLMNEDVLERISLYLDKESLMSVRLVCWRWYNVAQPTVNKRWIYKLPDPRYESNKVPIRVRLETGAFLNNWKTPYSFINTIDPLILKEFGAHVKCLVIKDFPLDEQSCAWFSNALPFAFANLEEIKVQFGKSKGQRIEHKQKETSGVRFTNLHTLTLKKGSFSKSEPKLDCVTNIIETCTGELQHLFLIGYTLLDVQLLEWLADNSYVTEGLTSFEFRSSSCGGVKFGEVREHLRLIKFSDKLKTFCWDGLHFGKDIDSTQSQILPGILDQIAGSITHFSTSEELWDSDSAIDRFSRMFLQVQLPIMPKLSVMIIDITTCYTISLSDLVDAAPNLQTLEVTGGFWNDEVNIPRAGIFIPGKEIWGGVENPMMKEHRALRVLKVETLLRDMTVLKKALQKFPCLEELSIRSHWDANSRRIHPINLENIIDVFQEFGMNIKKLQWESDGSHSLFGISKHLLQVEKLNSLLLYELLAVDMNADKDFDYRVEGEELTTPNHFFLEEYILRKEEILKELLTLQGRKCRIQIRGCRFYLSRDCNFEGHDLHKCMEVLEEFRTFFTNEGLPVAFY